MRVPDNLDLYEAHERRQAAELAKLPKCECCGEPIQDEYCYFINADVICEDCMNENFRRRTEIYGE